MIIKSSEVARYAANLPSNLAAALVFGPDQGLVRETAEILAKSAVSDLKDPFRIVELDEATLTTDNARLFDEAAAISMLGGRRVVRVRSVGNGLSKLFEAFLDDPRGDALIVVESGDLSKASSLRKVFETAANAAAIACYPDSAQGLADVVRRTLKSEGISISPEALDNVVARLGSDRGVTRSEVEKLTLYVGSGKCAELDDVRAILGNEAEAHVEEVCDAAGEGDRARLDAGLERLWSEGTTATAIIRTVISHFQKVLLARTRRTQRENIDSIIRSMRPPLHFARVNAFKNQVSRWSETRLLQVLDLLLETEALCKTTAVPAESACGRALHGVAAMARLPG